MYIEYTLNGHWIDIEYTLNTQGKYNIRFVNKVRRRDYVIFTMWPNTGNVYRISGYQYKAYPTHSI